MTATAVKPPATTRAYVTFLAGDGDYLKGVAGLAEDLRKVGSDYPLVVAVLLDVPEYHRQMLVSHGCIVREIKPVYPPGNQTQFSMAYYAINYSKLRIWEFVEYERMVYLDANVQVFENIDELFELEKGRFYAVMDKAAWPAAKLGPPPAPTYVNAGMFVHEPSMATAKSLVDTFCVTTPNPFAEQDFLNMFFRDQYKPIPLMHKHNLVLAMLEKVKVAHCVQLERGAVNSMEQITAAQVPVYDAAMAGFPATKANAGHGRGIIGILSATVGVCAASSAATAIITAGPASPAVTFVYFVLLLGGLSVAVVNILRGA